MPYPIKPMRLGEIFDQAIAIVRDHYQILFSILLILIVPMSLVQGFFLVSTMPVVPPDASPQEAMRLQQAWILQYWPWFTGIGLLHAFLIYPISKVAVIEAVARLYLGQPISVAEALMQGLRKLLPYLGTSILVGLTIFGGSLLCLVPGIIFGVWFALSGQAVVVEGIAGPTAMRRSKRLVLQDWVTFVALGVVLFGASAVLNGGSNFIPQPHLRVISATILQSVTMLVTNAAFVVYYFSCRCKLENFDLHFLAESIGAPLEEIEPGAAGHNLL